MLIAAALANDAKLGSDICPRVDNQTSNKYYEYHLKYLFKPDINYITCLLPKLIFS